jgi:predicted dithiol-disulfide oxidoreductase (DUF899 family)
MLKGGLVVERHAVVSKDEWIEARVELLAKEKEFTRLRDRLNEQRRELPWVRVDKEYEFEGPSGTVTLPDLFGGQSQLVVYHFMFPPSWEEGCPHCSFWADSFNLSSVHLNHRDTNLVAISRAPLEKITAFRERMGWSFEWVSSGGSDFNYDFNASFKPEEMESGEAFYNYRHGNPGFEDREGISVFYKDESGDIFHTYSAFARGIDSVNVAYQLLDLTPKGRDEAGAEFTQYWVRHHDKYDGVTPL